MSAPYARDVPSRIALVRAANRSANTSAMSSWTYNRSMEMQSWPAEEKQARTAPAAALSTSASASTTMAFLPPSSSETPTSRAAAPCATSRPVRVDPVKET